MTAAIELADAFKCTDCNIIIDEPEHDARYECESCGHEFIFSENETNRCPSCNKFAGKVADETCPDCYGPVEQIQVYHCGVCDTRHEPGDEPDTCEGERSELDENPSDRRLVLPPSGDARFGLTLPHGLRIKDMRHWAQDQVVNGLRFSDRVSWSLLSSNLAIWWQIDTSHYARNQPGRGATTKPYAASIGCSKCGRDTEYRAFDRALDSLARGAHRRGEKS